MYSAKINDEPTTFGTSGLLYRSNKVMYDRTTNSLWRQFTGEPVVGPLSDSGIKLPFFPVLLTTWGGWAEEHPDTTVLSIETGVYPSTSYRPESNPTSIYYEYFNSPGTMFPVPDRSPALDTKDVVLGLNIGDAFKAYPVEALQEQRVVNDSLGGTDVVVVASPISQAARVYERRGRFFVLSAEESTGGGLLTTLVDSDGVSWQMTEDYLLSTADPSQKLARLPTHMSFWFGWYSFHPDTLVYSPDTP